MKRILMVGQDSYELWSTSPGVLPRNAPGYYYSGEWMRKGEHVTVVDVKGIGIPLGATGVVTYLLEMHQVSYLHIKWDDPDLNERSGYFKAHRFERGSGPW